MKTNQNTTSHLFEINTISKQIIFALLLLLCLTSIISPPIALLLGLLVANLSGNPFLHFNHKAITILLQFSVVGLGFGMNA
ncbi:hypothetical protein, partial [Salmonella enterica]